MTPEDTKLVERLGNPAYENKVGNVTLEMDQCTKDMLEAAAAIRRLSGEVEQLKRNPRIHIQPHEIGSEEDLKAMGWVSYADHCHALSVANKALAEAEELLAVAYKRYTTAGFAFASSNWITQIAQYFERKEGK